MPAGDIGVGGKEIGFLYGQYKRITSEVTGALTGKGIGWGGSEFRPEATGYGVSAGGSVRAQERACQPASQPVCAPPPLPARLTPPPIHAHPQAVFFAEEMLKDVGDTIKGKRCVVSGSGNVATFCAEKLVEEGGVVVAMSDSRGFIHKSQGFTAADVELIMKVKSSHDGTLEDAAKSIEGAEYVGDR